MTSLITLLVYNGLANRLLPIISCLRLAKKTNRKINIVFRGTPIRTCIPYYGVDCTYYDLFKKNDNIIIDFDENNIKYDRTFNFEYWLNKETIIDVSGNCNIYVNYCLYTLLSFDDDKKSIFKNIQDRIKIPGEIFFDDIGNELGTILREEIKPVDELQDEINKDMSVFKTNMIGIHIRTSDGGFINHDWDNIVKNLISKSIIWCNENKDNGIFLATDSLKYYSEFASKFTTDQFIFYYPPEILCDTNSDNMDKFRNDKFNVLCAVVELYLLGSCNSKIIGTVNSTFSICSMLIASPNTKKYLINNIDNIPSKF